MHDVILETFACRNPNPLHFNIKIVMAIRFVKQIRNAWCAWKLVPLRWWLQYNQQHASTVKRCVALAWIAIVGMPVYFLIWTFWLPQPYENMPLRAFGFFLCFPGIFAQYHARKKWLPAYQFVGLTYTLPFFFTFMFLMNKGSPVWSQSLLIAVIILFNFQIGLAFLSYVTGTALACLAYYVFNDHGADQRLFLLDQLPIDVFAIVSVSLARLSRAALTRERLSGMAAAMSTLSHELRTPLLSVSANARGIQLVLDDSPDIPADKRAAMKKALARVDIEVRHMNNAVDLLLSSVSTNNHDVQTIETLSMATMVESALQRYPFTGEVPLERITVSVRSDFYFRGQNDLCSMILLNLLRNALSAIQRAGKGRIHIVVDGARPKPRLMFIDSGCGIEPARLPYIFERFYSSPESNGLGIGLAFCKEVLETWGARLRCVSRLHSHTVFMLEFPRLNEACPSNVAAVCRS